MSRFISKTLFSLALLLAVPPLMAEEIVVYSARNEHLIKPLFDRYQEQTGTSIRFITDKEGPLLSRLKAEGEHTPADLLITVDAGNLWHAAEQGVLAEIDSGRLQERVPRHLRDADGRWFGLSIRARTIVYSTERVKPAELSSYVDLADPKWRGRLCLRTSKKVYNQSLVAMLIDRLGEVETERVVRGWVANLAQPPFSNDTRTMEAILSGACDIGIVNTYYFGRMQKRDPEIKLALFWADQDGDGVHVNISGAGVTKYAKHPAEAKRFLEWLASVRAQELFAGLNLEYPVNPKVSIAPQVAGWGGFKPDDRPVARAGELQARAVMLMDRAGYH